MFFRKKPLSHKSIKKVDALVTGLILGWVVASIYGIQRGVSNAKKEEKIPAEPKEKLGIIDIIKLLIFGVPKEKPSLAHRILDRILWRK